MKKTNEKQKRESPSVTDVLNELGDQLRYASELDRTGEPGNRIGATYSLAYLIQALTNLNYQQDELRPLERLLHSLGDLELGIQPALLTKNILTDAPKQGHKEAALYAMAAVMIDLLAEQMIINGELKNTAEDQAAKRVSAFMLSKGLSLPGRQETPGFKSLLNWRKNMIYEKKNKIAIKHYETFSDFVGKMNPADAVNVLQIRMATH